MPAGLLRLTVVTDFATKHLMPIVSDFLTRNPAAQVDLNLSSRIADLMSEGFDFAIRICDLRDSTLIRRKLAESTVHIFAGPTEAGVGTTTHRDSLFNQNTRFYRSSCACSGEQRAQNLGLSLALR